MSHESKGLALSVPQVKGSWVVCRGERSLVRRQALGEAHLPDSTEMKHLAQASEPLLSSLTCSKSSQIWFCTARSIGIAGNGQRSTGKSPDKGISML